MGYSITTTAEREGTTGSVLTQSSHPSRYAANRRCIGASKQNPGYPEGVSCKFSLRVAGSDKARPN